MQDRLAPVAEPLVHEDGDGIDLQALRAPAEGAVGRRVAATDDVHPERLLGRRLEQVDLDVEVVLLGELVHPRQRAFDHFGDGRDFHARVGAEDRDRFFPLCGGDGQDGVKDQ